MMSIYSSIKRNLLPVSALLGALALVAFSYHQADARPMTYPIPEPESPRLIVRDDGGGAVDQFKSALRYAQKEHLKIRLEGYCASACTLLFSTDFDLDVCITPDVRLGIHSPYWSNGIGVSYRLIHTIGAEKLWREEFYSKYPQRIQTMIDIRGGAPSVNRGAATSDLLWLSYPELKSILKTCV